MTRDKGRGEWGSTAISVGYVVRLNPFCCSNKITQTVIYEEKKFILVHGSEIQAYGTSICLGSGDGLMAVVRALIHSITNTFL
jgi:hypothetical protein